MRRVFIQILPKILFIERPFIQEETKKKSIQPINTNTISKLPNSIRRALLGVSYMHSRMIKNDNDRKVIFV